MLNTTKWLQKPYSKKMKDGKTPEMQGRNPVYGLLLHHSGHKETLAAMILLRNSAAVRMTAHPGLR